MKAAVDRLLGRWRARPVRERRLLALASLVLVPALLVFGVWLPLGEHAKKLERRLQSLERQVAEMRGMRSALQAIPKAEPTAAGAASPLVAGEAAARLEAELNAAIPGFKGSVRSAEGGLDLVVEAAPFDALLPWLETWARRESWFVSSLQFSSRPDGLSSGAAGSRAGWTAGRARLVGGRG